MMRIQIVKLARATPSIHRSFTVTAFRGAEGDVGGTRSGGSASSDAFSRREAASESKYIREREIESMKKLKEKLAAQQKHVKELDDHIKELEESQRQDH